jgi:hypothetical protein
MMVYTEALWLTDPGDPAGELESESEEPPPAAAAVGESISAAVPYKVAARRRLLS